ncbi:helix-turn-helix domain-containing protein [Nostoc sp. C057]|uniref:helix-turn-helix domain-containing protein n=1 Tax=Nostoc sp. C057 TaxID=2576903 RepID=UPI0015C38866|nr:helix-turn-helix domain-containing protein [Nostoc sp. C057]QLE51640.1 helix-turn-helix domain-containing protein [Nostoc sp. C057]
MTDSASNNSSELVSVAQTANLLGITRQRVHDLIKNGQIIACKLGRYYYIEVAEVERYKNQPIGKPYQPRSTTSQKNSIDNCQ